MLLKTKPSKGKGPILEIRKILGMTQCDLAKELGVHHPLIAVWEKKGIGPRKHETRCRVLEISRAIPRSQQTPVLREWMRKEIFEYHGN